MTRPTAEFQIWRDKAGMWRWLLADSNGVTLCVGDAQGSWDACVKKIDRVRRLGPATPLAAPCARCRKMAVLSTETQ